MKIRISIIRYWNLLKTKGNYLPLNIAQFALATASRNALEKDKLLEKINAKSVETARSFAQEIKRMSTDKILFLSFPFISEYFSVDFVKDNYQELLRELKIEEEEQDVLDFVKILEWFKDDKIDLRSYDSRKKIKR